MWYSGIILFIMYSMILHKKFNFFKKQTFFGHVHSIYKYKSYMYVLLELLCGIMLVVQYDSTSNFSKANIFWHVFTSTNHTCIYVLLELLLFSI